MFNFSSNKIFLGVIPLISRRIQPRFTVFRCLLGSPTKINHSFYLLTKRSGLFKSAAGRLKRTAPDF